MTDTRVGIGEGEARSFREIYFIYACDKPYLSFSSVEETGGLQSVGSPRVKHD